MRDPGCNVSEWNMDHLPRLFADDTLFVGCVPAVFIHFTGITIRKITEGIDPALTPYLEQYRKLLEACEQRIQLEQLGLLKDHTPILSSSCASAKSPDTVTVAWIVDYQTAVDALLQIETMKEADAGSKNGIWVLCSDFESYEFLSALDLPDAVHLVHWKQLDNYRLCKVRKDYERRSPFEGNQRRFSRACVPFFIKYLLLEGARTAILVLTPRTLWQSTPTAFLQWLGRQEGPVIAANESDDVLFVFAKAQPEHLQLIGLWENRVAKASDIPPRGETSTAPSAAQWVSLSEEQIPPVVLARARPGKNDPSGDAKSPSSWWVYEPDTLRVQDGRPVYGDGFFHGPKGMKENVNRWVSRIIDTYGLAPSTALRDVLSRVPIADVVDTAIQRAIDIQNVGNQMGEFWNAEISDAMRAYILYLIAVRCYQSGDTDRAEALLTTIAASRMLISDLYRSKTLFHLATIAEEKGRIREAVARYQKCLVYSPYHPMAQRRLAVLVQARLRPDEMNNRSSGEIR
jgi:hypothetical protein